MFQRHGSSQMEAEEEVVIIEVLRVRLFDFMAEVQNTENITDTTTTPSRSKNPKPHRTSACAHLRARLPDVRICFLYVIAKGNLRRKGGFSLPANAGVFGKIGLECQAEWAKGHVMGCRTCEHD